MNLLNISESSFEVIQFVGNDHTSVILYNNYTFSYQGPKDIKRYLYCSKRSKNKCKARINLDRDGNIRYTFTEHNHPPPILKKFSDGRYYKVE